MTGGHGSAFPALGGGYTALMAAAAGKHRVAVEELINRGADLNQADYSGRTALAYARGVGADDIVVLLRARGAQE